MSETEHITMNNALTHRTVITTHVTCLVVVTAFNNIINVKKDVYKNGYRRRSCTSKTAKIHRFVRFVMYCSITTVPVAFY